MIKKSMTILFCIYLTGCASLKQSIKTAEIHCEDLFKKQQLNISSEKDKWNKREYIKCVSQLTHAEEQNKVAHSVAIQNITKWSQAAIYSVIGVMMLLKINQATDSIQSFFKK